jgi:hypothetical protein
MDPTRTIFLNQLTMKLAILSVLVASAAAFAPASQKASSSALAKSKSPYAGELGAQVPVSTMTLVEQMVHASPWYPRSLVLTMLRLRLFPCGELIVA